MQHSQGERDIEWVKKKRHRCGDAGTTNYCKRMQAEKATGCLNIKSEILPIVFLGAHCSIQRVIGAGEILFSIFRSMSQVLLRMSSSAHRVMQSILFIYFYFQCPDIPPTGGSAE